MAVVMNRTLWVSLKSGHIAILNLHNVDDLESIRLVKRHESDVRLLFTSSSTLASCDSENISIVFSVGKGFLEFQVTNSALDQKRVDVALKPWHMIAWRASESF